MAKPTATTEFGGTKVAILADNAATTPNANTPVSIVGGVSTEATYRIGWMGFATHADDDTITAPGGHTAPALTKGPVVLVAAQAGPSGTTVVALHTDTTTPGASDEGLVVRNIPTGTQTVSVTGAVDTELPAAASLADNASNPTAPAVGAFNMLWDGATWDRFPGTSVDGALVNLGTNNDVVVTGTVTVDSELTTADLDTGVGTDTRAVVGLVLAASGGGLLVGSANPMPVSDNAGSLTVDGSVSITGAVDTELPAAAALADNTANPTVPAVGAFGMLWDGATWDRFPGTSADGALVNLGANNDVVGAKSSNGGVPGATNLGVLPGIATAAAPTYTEGNQVGLSTDLAGSLRVTGGGGGVEYAEDTPHVSGDTLKLAGVVQQAADAALAGDGDRTLLQVDGSGFLKVNIKAGAGSGGTAMADDAAFTVAVTSFTPAGGTYRSVRDAVDDNDGGAFAMNQKRGQFVTLEDSASNEIASAVAATTGSERGLLTREIPANRTASGTLGALNATVVINAEGTGTVHVEVDSGLVSSTIVFEATLDDTNWFAVNAVNPADTIKTGFSTGADTFPTEASIAGGWSQVRLRVSVYGSGSASARLEATQNASVVRIGGTLPAVGGILNAVVAGTGSTNLGKAEDAGHANGDTGVFMLAVRNDSASTGFTSADLDYSPIAVDQSGKVWVMGSFIDGQASVAGTTRGITAGAVFDDAAPSSVAEDKQGYMRMSARRELYTQIRDAAGNERGINVDANNEIGIGAIRTSVTPGTAAANLGKAEDAVHASGDTGVFMLCVANEANTVFTSADGDYVPMGTDREGSTRTIGNRAHDAVDAGAPVKIGFKAVAHGSSPTAVAAADRTDALANRHGIPFSLGGHPNIISFEAAYTAAQTDTAIVTVAGGSKIVVTEIEALCDNANTVDVGLRVGFGATTTPTTTGVVLTHPGIAHGSGVVRGSGAGILAIGADGEDLRITSEVPTSGSLRILVSYFTIES